MTRQEALAIAKPILFNTEMVQAILDDTKTVTRRVIKPPYFVNVDRMFPMIFRSAPKGSYVYRKVGAMPYPENPYKVGAILYVRETFCFNNFGVHYKADFPCDDCPEMYFDEKWHPSIHMPKEAARIFLRVTSVNVERLQDITEEQAIAEGIEEKLLEENAYKLNGGKKLYNFADASGTTYFAKTAFSALWDSTIPKADLDRYGWNANPWVGAYEFERVMIDE